MMEHTGPVHFARIIVVEYTVVNNRINSEN